MAQTQHYFFVIEFYVANEFGMAITTADNKRSAAEFLKNEGKYNSAPELYEIKSIRNVGKYFGNCIGLLLEHYGDAGSAASITKEDIINALGGEPLLQNEVINIDCGYANSYGQSESVKGSLQVRRDTTNNWDNSIGIIPKEGEIIVYTDHIDRGEGENPRYIPGVKIGTGTAYARDLPFLDDDLRERVLDHIADMTMHITAEDRTFWNHKLNWSGTVEDGLLILNRN